MRCRWPVRGRRVERYNKKRGWFMPKHRLSIRDNPVSIFRDILMLTGQYPASNNPERSIWDKTLGDLFLYAEHKIDGIIITPEFENIIVNGREPVTIPVGIPIKKKGKRK